MVFLTVGRNTGQKLKVYGGSRDRVRSTRDLAPPYLSRNYLELVHRQSKGEHEGVPQRVNWLEHADVLDQGLVPQVAHQKGQENNPYGNGNNVVDSLLASLGAQNRNHLFY